MYKKPKVRILIYKIKGELLKSLERDSSQHSILLDTVKRERFRYRGIPFKYSEKLSDIYTLLSHNYTYNVFYLIIETFE